jgi:hypothetical protein
MPAYSSFGTLVQMGSTNGGGGTFTTIGQVLDISGPEFTVDTEETTNQSSAGGYEEFIPTIKRSGNVTFDVLYDPSNATHEDASTGLIFVMVSRALRGFRLLMPVTPAKQWNWLGYVVGFGQANAVAGTQRASITIKISGQPTIS